MAQERAQDTADTGQTAPVLEPGHTFSSVTEKISSLVLTRGTSLPWYLGFAFMFGLFMVLLLAITYLFVRGVGIWGINIPVGWGFAITNFVWWIGIGHAGTLISAILLLFRQEWRTSINRFAEAMTLFAVGAAALFPLLHLGRPQYFYWLIPYPTTFGVWPQFRSPLVWDLFAIFVYGTVSLLFWFIGLLPDLATMRDRAKSRFVKVVYGFLAMGWRGSARHWLRYRRAYFLLAALATPLVISVHSIVSFDFAVSLVPGWHSTVFPPYFVAGAIFSGMAMVLVIAIPLRAFFDLEDFITMRHLNNMALVMLASGLFVAYGYIVETFFAWYSGSVYESQTYFGRLFGQTAPLFWPMIVANVLVPQLLWIRPVRRNIAALFVIALVVLVGMWLERFVIVVTSLEQDFLPSSWDTFTPTIWDWATFVGTVGMFFALLFLFIRILPIISIFEMRELVAEQQQEEQRETGMA